MAKYEKLDTRVFRWLGKHLKDLTTVRVFKALHITNPVEQRHVSRRFTQLEDKGILVCKLNRTMRVCVVAKGKTLPKTLTKKRWAPRPAPTIVVTIQSIPAEDSNQFELAGGKIERLGTRWNNSCSQIPTGSSSLLDYIDDVD